MEPLRAEIAVGMADIKTGKSPEVLTTVLGSCIGLCLYSPRHQAGGLLHLMMPTAKDAIAQPGFKKAKYADTGVPELVRILKATYGIAPSEIVAKMFGGAKVLKDVERNLGGENADIVKALLKEYGIALKSGQVGGTKGYRIKLFLDSGNVQCQVFGSEPEEF